MYQNFEYIHCIDNCCGCPGEDCFCFSDYNFTDVSNITEHEEWEVALKYLFSTFLAIFGVIGNFSIILILLKNKLLLRSTINHFIFTMCLADLTLAAIGPLPFAIFDTSTFWPFSEFWCKCEGLLRSKHFINV